MALMVVAPQSKENQLLQEAAAKKMVPVGFPGPCVPRHAAMAGRNLFSALFLSKDIFGLEPVRKLFENYGIEFHHAQTVAQMEQWMRGRRLDLVLCDYDAPGVSGLSCLQANTRWRGISMVLAGRQHVHEIRGKRVHFTVPKPFSLDALAKGLRASYTTMASQRVASYRHTLALRPLAGRLEYRGLQRALTYTSIANLSQTGLCLAGPEPLPQGGTISVNFSLPETDQTVHVIGTIIWSDASGKSGVCFNRISAQQQKLLQQSLKSRLPWNVDFLFPPE
jgi:CheY-like chemotaxis protein